MIVKDVRRAQAVWQRALNDKKAVS